MELGRTLQVRSCKTIKYSSARYSSSKLQWSGGVLQCLNWMDCYVLFPVVSVRLLMVSEHRWLTLLREKILISDLLRSLLMSFWGETARLGRPTANLVIVFERSHNLKAWLRFAPRRVKIFLASLATACIRSVVALWSVWS